MRGILPRRLRRFLGFLTVGLLGILLLADVLERTMPGWFPDFPAALSGAAFLAIGLDLFFLGGHVYGSLAGIGPEEAGVPMSGMLMMRLAGEDKLNDIQAEDWKKWNFPSRERVVTLTALALVFLAVSVAVATVSNAWIAVVVAPIPVAGIVLVDAGVRWAASS